MERGSDEIVEHFSGASIEIGSRLLFRKNRRRGMDFGLTIPLTDGGESERRAELEAQGYQTPAGGANIGGALLHINVGYRQNF